MSRFDGPSRRALAVLVALSACAGCKGKRVAPDAGDPAGGGDTGGAAGSTAAQGGADDTGGGATSGADGGVATGGAATAGAAGAAASSRLCPTASAVPAPSAADDCRVTPRTIDPERNCGGGSPCPITRAFDLDCGFDWRTPRLSVSEDRTRLLLRGAYWITHLVGVTDTDATVATIDRLSGAEDRISSTASGPTWYFSGDSEGIVALSERGDAWYSSAVVLDPEETWVDLADARMADEARGYVLYRMGPGAPHLVTWDGACWTDESLGSDPAVDLSLGVDDRGLPWTALVTADAEGLEAVTLRDPGGVLEPVPAAPVGPYAGGSHVKVLPGGLDGADASLALALRSAAGIEIQRRDPGIGWSAQVLPGSAPGEGTSDCPPWVDNVDPDPCAGQPTSCSTELAGAGWPFDLARTESRGTFAVWVSYASTAESTLGNVNIDSGEMPHFACLPIETSGSGTAELVVARLGDAEPVVTRFPFELGGGLLHLTQPVAAAARGDTLVIVAVLSGGDPPALTYLEIDTTSLP